MNTHQAVNESLILRMKPGVDLPNVPSESNSSAAKSFIQSIDIVKAQSGFVSHFWGLQVEDPNVFVWSIDWESFKHVTAFKDSDEHDKLMASMEELFYLSAGEPLTLYARFTSSPTLAFAAPVTEIAYFCVPQGAVEEAKRDIEATTDISSHPVFSVGKSCGGAIGFVFNTINGTNVVPSGREIVLVGVFGYASVEDHYTWRSTPEHAKIVEDSASSALTKLGLEDGLNMPGGNRFVAESSMFHVKFQRGG